MLRGGYGLYYLGQSAFGANQGFTNTSSAVISTNGLTPAVDLTNPFALLPNGQLLSPIGSSQGASSFLGQSVSAQYYNRPLPYSSQYSFNIQHEFKGGFLAEIG